MSPTLRRFMQNVLRLGSGELLARVCGVTTVLLLAHRYGVVMVGVYALAQSMDQYSKPVIDFGLKHVGARLVAVYPQAAHEIVRRVQWRRLRMALGLLPVLLVYAAFTKLPLEFRICLLVFAAICTLHVLSLDWLAWGREHLNLVGLGRSIVPVFALAALVLGRHSANILWWLVVGSGIGGLVQGFVFWAWWRTQEPVEGERIDPSIIDSALAWRKTSILGFATLCNMAFNTIDMVMLGLMSNAQQVGLYSASYRVMNQVLYSYYLFTQVLYPQMARQNLAQRRRMVQPRILLALLCGGCVIAASISAVRRPLLAILFGHQFVSAGLLLMILTWAIPFDFLTSYLSNAYVAWGMEKRVLVCTGIAAASNVALNLYSIPTHGATAAAVNTLISYGIFLISLTLAGRYAKELARDPVPQPSVVRA